ncbi:hypothetical protein [Wielerella bovis]|uniref:hypothetical protein n=1 Tax=Wielerella bovis TaxID=2917790 RepID=UPI002018D209|nr:hypothetical protein [Wielerella bovis]ULJ61201.1 hypothetical protein MIS44_04960 [Wielerella bovis]
MVLKKIHYYLDPKTEKNDFFFRYGTLKSIYLPQINKLLESNPNLEISLSCSQGLLNRAKQDNLNLDNITIIKLDNTIFDSIDNLNNIVLQEDNQAQFNSITDYLKDVFKNFNAPDLVITYENSTHWLKDIFPNAVFLHETFGAFSRAPFALFESFNPCEPLWGSFQNKFSKELKAEKLSDEEADLLRKFRRQSMKSLAELTPFKQTISAWYDEYDSVCLLACQVDDYFAFTACSEYQTQESLVRYVLENIPTNIALVVTEHAYSRSLSDECVTELSKKYHNFKYLSEEIPSVSQFLVPYIDGVISVSSSLAYQAALWQKPFFAIGCSHVDIFRTAETFEQFNQQVLQQDLINQDGMLYHLLSAVHISHKFELFNGEALYQYLNKLYQAIKEKGVTYNLFKRKNVGQMHKIFTQDNRLGILRSQMKESGIPLTTDHLRVAMCADVDAMSFDLFDTLAERDFIEPWELFSFIEPEIRRALNNKNFQFCNFRRQAEADIRRPTRGEFEITLDEIYQEFQTLTGLSDEQCDLIKQLEKQAEFDLVKPKKRMVREYRFAKLVVKKRSILTDIYLEQDDIEQILQRIGITDYDYLISSATNRTRKHNGSMYGDYLKLMAKDHIGVEKCLHTGDNAHADGDMARRHGLRAYVFPKAMDNFHRSSIAGYLSGAFSTKNVATSIPSGLIANKFYAEPWNKLTSDNLFAGSNFKYGYCAIGSLVLGFSQWLYRRARLNGTKKLYFLARDGYILKEAFDTLYGDDPDAPQTEYLLSSRRSVIVPAIQTKEDIHELASLNFNARTLKSFLINRFGVEIEQIPSHILEKYRFKEDTIVSPQFHFAKLLALLTEIQDIIFATAQAERETYLQYLEEKQFIKDLDILGEKGVALVDIGYSGTMQYYLTKLLGKKMNGYYFLTHNFARDYYPDAVFEGYLANLDDHRTAYRHKLNDFVFIFESAFSSQDGSLLKFERDGQDIRPIFIEAEEEKVRQQALQRIHDGVNVFIHDVKQRFGNRIHEFELSAIVASRLLLAFAEHPSQKDAALFLNLEVENLFGGGSVKLINTVQGTDNPDAQQIEELIKTSHWKPGAKAFYKKPSTPIKALSQKQIELPQTTQNLHSLPDARRQAKKNKLIKDPYQFFSDSQKPFAQVVKQLFKQDSTVGKLNTKILRKIIK